MIFIESSLDSSNVERCVLLWRQWIVRRSLSLSLCVSGMTLSRCVTEEAEGRPDWLTQHPSTAVTAPIVAKVWEVWLPCRQLMKKRNRWSEKWWRNERAGYGQAAKMSVSHFHRTRRYQLVCKWVMLGNELKRIDGWKGWLGFIIMD